MDLKLTPAETEQFRAALLHAFPHRGALKQLVSDLGEDLDQLVPSGTYVNMVTDLIKWADATGKTRALLSAARQANPSDDKLLEFQCRIMTRLNSPAGSPPAQRLKLKQEYIRLDVLYPAQARVDEAFDIAVAVRQPDAPVLTIDDLSEIISEQGSVFRPAGEGVIKYRFEVVSADCAVSPSHYVILLRRGENARPCFFQVIAHKSGERTIFVNAYQEDEALIAQTRVHVVVQLAVEAPIRLDDFLVLSQTLKQPLRLQLVDAVLLLPVSQTPEGRSAYLLGLPMSLDRNPSNAQADLNMIFDQLDRLGPLASGEWPLLLVIDNILPFAKGFAIHSVISDWRHTLEEAYGAH
jgi:hypothetical protein